MGRRGARGTIPMSVRNSDIEENLLDEKTTPAPTPEDEDCVD